MLSLSAKWKVVFLWLRLQSDALHKLETKVGASTALSSWVTESFKPQTLQSGRACMECSYIGQKMYAVQSTPLFRSDQGPSADLKDERRRQANASVTGGYRPVGVLLGLWVVGLPMQANMCVGRRKRSQSSSLVRMKRRPPLRLVAKKLITEL
jgi:hypothetical protein